MNIQPFLEDDLILIRPLKEEDFEALYAVASDPLIWEQHPSYDRYQRVVYTKLFEESLQSKGAMVVVDKRSGQIIGSSRYVISPNDNTAVEIGWSFLARKYWGGQYNGAKKKLMIDHAFQSGMKRVLFYIAKENIRSQKAVEKIGGQRLEGAAYAHLSKNPDVNFTYGIENS